MDAVRRLPWRKAGVHAPMAPRRFPIPVERCQQFEGQRSPPDCRSPRAAVEFFTQAIAEIGQVQSLLICAQHAPGIVEVAGSGAHPSKSRRELVRYQERRPVAQCVRPTPPVGQAAISRPLLFRSGSNYTPLGRVNRIPESGTPPGSIYFLSSPSATASIVIQPGGIAGRDGWGLTRS